MPVNPVYPPCYFGMWSGPSYAGGKEFSANGDPDGVEFVRLMQKTGTKPVSFLDAAARQHDIAYELASRLYPANPADPKRDPAELKAAKLRADLDLMKNALAYRPADNDFIGKAYREMIVNGFYFQAVRTYGMQVQMERLWKSELQAIDPEFKNPGISAAPIIGFLGLIFKIGDAFGATLWGNLGLEKLTTSHFLIEEERKANLGLTQQEMLFFNEHLGTSSTKTPSRTMGSSAPDGSPTDSIARMVVMPEKRTDFVDPDALSSTAGNLIYFAAGSTDSLHRRQMWIENVGTPANRTFVMREEYVSNNVDIPNTITRTTWERNNLIRPDEFGNWTYTKTTQKYQYHSAPLASPADLVAIGAATVETITPPPTPSGLITNDDFGWIEAAVQNKTWALRADALRARDDTSFNLLFPGYLKPATTGMESLMSKDAALLASEAQSSAAARYALTYLEPFTRQGADFSNAAFDDTLDLYDAATGEGQFTEQYIIDRATLLAQEINNPEQIDTYAVRYEDTTLDFDYGDLNATTKVVFGVEDSKPFTWSDIQVHVYGGAGDNSIQGSSFDDYLQGDAGIDLLEGGGGQDTLRGGAGNDQLSGGDDADTLEGGSGTDTLTGGRGADKLIGGTGYDTYLYTTGDGLDTIIDVDGRGKIEIDGLVLGTGTNSGDGRTYHFTDAANRPHTYFILTGNGNTGGDLLIDDKITVKDFKSGDLGLTLDTAQIAAAPTTNEITQRYIAKLFHMTFPVAVWQTLSGDLTTQDTPMGPAGLVQIHWITPNYENWVLVSYDISYYVRDAATQHFIPDLAQPYPYDNMIVYDTPANDHIVFGEGNDEIYANDIIAIGPDKGRHATGGDDVIETGAGRDSVSAGPGNDLVIGGPDTDFLRGDRGDDRIYADAEVSIETAIDNGNTQAASDGGETLSGDMGFNYDAEPEGNDLLVGGTGNDVLQGNGGQDLLIGGAGDDDIIGDNMFWGGYIPKVSVGDQLYTAMQANRRFWQPNYTDPSPHGGADVIYAGNGNDFAWGGVGNDVILGEGGDDRLVGEEEDDVILGGAENDVIWGDSAVSLAVVEGDDWLDGGDGNDTIYGGGGDDVLIGGAGSNILYGGAGHDTYVFEAGSQNTVYDTGENSYRFGAGFDPATLKLRVGSLRLEFGDGSGVHLMNVDHNGLYASLGGTDFEFADGTVLSSSELLARGIDIEGSDGDDTLTGTNAPDRINGTKGNDTLIGGAGVDTYLYQRGDGADTLVDSADWRWDATSSAWVRDGNVLSLGAGIAVNDITARLDSAADTSCSKWALRQARDRFATASTSGRNMTSRCRLCNWRMTRHWPLKSSSTNAPLK